MVSDANNKTITVHWAELSGDWGARTSRQIGLNHAVIRVPVRSGQTTLRGVGAAAKKPSLDAANVPLDKRDPRAGHVFMAKARDNGVCLRRHACNRSVKGPLPSWAVAGPAGQRPGAPNAKRQTTNTGPKSSFERECNHPCWNSISTIHKNLISPSDSTFRGTHGGHMALPGLWNGCGRRATGT